MQSTSTKTLCSISDLLGPDKNWIHLFTGWHAGAPSFCGERRFNGDPNANIYQGPTPRHCPDCIRLHSQRHGK